MDRQPSTTEAQARADRIAKELASLITDGLVEFRDIAAEPSDSVQLFIEDSIRDYLLCQQ